MNSVEFELWLEHMRALPASDPRWSQAREFISNAIAIIESKEAENTKATKLATLLNEVREQFSGELEYLGRDIDSAEAGFTSFNNALKAVKKLEDLLLDYRSVLKLQPKSFDDEPRLNEEKSVAGKRIRDSIQELNELLSNSEPEFEDTTPETYLNAQVPHTVIEYGHEDIEALDELTFSVSEPDKDHDSGRSEIQEDLADSISSPESGMGQAVSSDIDLDAVSMVSEQGDKAQGQDVETLTFSQEDTNAANSDDDQIQGLSSAQPDIPRYGIEASTKSSERFLVSSSLYDLETLMWSLIAEDDLSGAYWISIYLDAEGYESPATPMLMKALQGARWLPSDVDRFAGELFEIVADYVQLERSSSQDLLEFAASIHSTAIASHSQMLDWLQTPDCCPDLEPIVRQVRGLPNKGVSLRPEYVTGLGETVSQHEGIASASEDAHKWIEEAPMKRTKYGRANSVWKHLTDNGGELREMFDSVKNDVRSDVGKVREKLSEWNPDSSMEVINLIDHELETGKVPKPPITGNARNWLLRGIDDAMKKADRWCRLVEAENEVRAGLSNSYIIEQVSDLRSQVQSVCQAVIEALAELSSEANRLEIAAAALCARRSFQQFLNTLGIDSDAIKPTPTVAEELKSVIGNSEKLDQAMARRLLWTDSVNLDDDGLPFRDSLDIVIRDLARSVRDDYSLVQAIENRFDRQDYRFFDIVINRIPDEIKDSITTRRQKGIQGSIAMLKEYMASVERGVQQAARDGVIEIDDANWIDYNKKIEEIQSREDTLNFPALIDDLKVIEIDLKEDTERRYGDMCAQWESALSNQSDTDSNAISWKEKFESARDRADIRVMEECLIRLRNGDSYQAINLEDDTQNNLKNFISFCEEVQDIEGHTRSSMGLNTLKSRLTSLG